MKKVCIALTAVMALLMSSSIFAQTVWVPAKINGQKGDVVLSAGEPGEMIADLLAIFGGYWSHTGMLVDDGENIRHNTMYVDEIPQDTNGCGIPYRLNPDGISNGLPGILTEDVDTTYNNEVEEHRGFKLAGGVIVMPKDENEAAYRDFLELVADKMVFLKAYYRVNAYVDMMQLLEIDYLQKGTGNHCSGTVWYANYFSGKTMNIATIPPDVVDECCYNLYDSVVLAVEEEVGCAKIFAPDVATDIANQVVNTFGWDRSDDLSDYWRSQEGKVTAHANAPDHLLLSSFTNPLGKNVGVQTEDTSCYGKVVPIEWTDGYYIGEDPDSGGDDGGCG